MFNWVIEFYKSGAYTVDNLKLFVRVGWITADDFKNATGESYQE